MIHKFKTDGQTTFRAYSLRDDDGGGYYLEYLDSFEDTEQAKDALHASLTKQLRDFERQLMAFRIMVSAEGWDTDEEYDFSVVRHQATALYEDGFFILENAASLFKGSDENSHQGVTRLHGEAAIEYAARQGMPVKYAELERGNYIDGHPIEVSPGQARERMPERRNRWLWVEVPADTVTDDLPPSGRPFDMPRASEPMTPERLRAMAARWRESAKEREAEAAEMEAEAAEMEAAEATA